MSAALPPVVDAATWQRELDALRVREKAATRELDAVAAQRRRLPMVKMPDYVLEGEEGPVRLADVFNGKTQLIVYSHMWFPGEDWQCPGCTGFTAQYTRLEFLDNYDARFVIVAQGPIDEALAYKRRVGNKMTWYSTANSPFGSDVGAPPGGGFAVNVFLRDGDTVYRTWHTNGRGTEQLSHTFPLIDLLPYGRQEAWQDSPEGWPQDPTYSRWGTSQDIAKAYGPDAKLSRGYVARQLARQPAAPTYEQVVENEKLTTIGSADADAHGPRGDRPARGLPADDRLRPGHDLAGDGVRAGPGQRAGSAAAL